MVKFLYIVCIAKHKKNTIDSMSGLFFTVCKYFCGALKVYADTVNSRYLKSR